MRMADDRIPKDVFYGELDAGQHGEDNESGIRTCLRQRLSHAAFPTTPGKPPRQTVPSGAVPATPVYETTKRRGATP